MILTWEYYTHLTGLEEYQGLEYLVHIYYSKKGKQVGNLPNFRLNIILYNNYYNNFYFAEKNFR